MTSEKQPFQSADLSKQRPARTHAQLSEKAKDLFELSNRLWTMA